MTQWKPYVPITNAPWNLQRVVHLHRRAAYGATWSEIQRDLADGPQNSVSRLLDGTSRSDCVPANFEELSDTIVNAAVEGGDSGRLKAWWIYRCLFSPDPLTERLTLMWHNHFATSVLKVTNLKWMLKQNQTFRQNAKADFRLLIAAMLEDPALLTWLDATENLPGHPNENLGRELLELFTLGIGNYSEQDIREAARALTGITIDDGTVIEDSSKHDSGKKTILGVTKEFQRSDLPDLLISQRATSERLAWRLCQEFFGESVVTAEATQELAAGLRENQMRISWAVETILRSELFFDQRNLNQRVADPASFLLAPLRSLECVRQPPSTLALADALRRMGLDLFAPPNVGGWPGGRTWLSTRTVIARTNAAADLLQGRMHLPAHAWDSLALVEHNGVKDNFCQSIRFLGQLLWGQIDDRLVDETAEACRMEPDPTSRVRTATLVLLTQPQAQFH